MMSKIVFGIDVGGTAIKCGCFSEGGELLEKNEIPTRKENSGEYILSDISEYIKNMLDQDELERVLEDTYSALNDTNFLLDVIDKNKDEYSRLLKSKEVDLKIKEKLEKQTRRFKKAFPTMKLKGLGEAINQRIKKLKGEK